MSQVKPVHSVHYTPARDEVGIFPGNVKPTRAGMYKRISKKGNIVWSHYDPHGTHGGWGKYGTNKNRAYQRRNKRSKEQSLPWIGLAESANGTNAKA